MVRETRHLWVGNLPENVREDRIRDHFKRYGRVQSVKLLPREKDDEGSGVCATVSFMDIKSASKAHNNEQKLEDRTLTTEYHEPAAIPGSGPPLYASQRFSHGPPDEISTFERSSHFYERERDRRDGDAYLRRASSTYHVTAADTLRGRTRDRHYRNGPYAPIIESVVSRQPPHHRNVSSAWTYETPSRYPQPATTPDVYSDERRDLTPVVVVHKKHTKSRSGSSGSNSGSSVSRSRSSSSSSQSGSSSCSSASSSPASDKSCSTHSHHGSLRSGVTLQSAVSTPHTNNSSPAVHSDDRRPLAICVRNLPARSSDTSLKDGLFHEYKKHGKVTWVKVVGQGSDRYALVCFKKPEDVEKALQVSHDKLFFGCKIEVAPYQGYDVDDNEFRFVARPYEAEQDEFHPKATRTLFIGNLEKDITAPDLRKHFDQFGEIIEIDIKKQGSNSSYAFCQYCDIGSVVRAIRTLDGEHLGNNRIKLGFGKSLHTNCVWVDGVAESVTEKYLSLQFSQFGPVSHVAIDRSRGHALVFYDQIAFAQSAVKEMRGVAVRGRKLQVDFASRECQEAFYDHLEKQTGHNTTFDNSLQVSPQGVTTSVTRGFETPSSSSSSSGGGGGAAGAVTGSVRYPRFTSQPTVTRTYTRSTSAVSPGASPSTPARSTPRHVTTTPRFDLNLDYLSERRPYRSYEEMAAEDGGGIVTVTVGQGPQDIRHLQKERVALLEQLEDCASSGEEGSSRRRCKHRRSHSGDGSRPGTPLCDERPENLLPVEPRRTPRERPPDPLSLPLPRFATQLLSPRPAPPSPPASPPRPKSTSSDDSEPSPPSPEWEERLRSLDEKYEKWSGSRTVMTKVDPTTLKVRHKLLDLDLHELQPSDIVKSVLAKRSVFDEDSKRLENFGEKYEPRGEFVPTRAGFTPLRPRIESPLLHSPSAPKSPASASTPAGAKGLQYPFPSHPPVQPTTSVATTTAAMSIASCSSISSGTNVLSPNPSMDSSKSLQTFLTSCVSSVPSIRLFQTPPSQFHAPPKISPSAPSEKKVENIDPRLDRLKNSQKPLQPPNTIERVDSGKKDVLPPTSLKPLKSCLRRDSGDERGESDGRRRSREEDSKTQVFKSECDRGKEQEMMDKRRSLSDPRRRDSVDSNADGFRCESASDKLKDRNHKEDRRRRDSADNSAIKKDTETSDTVKSRLSDSRVSEHPDTIQCSNFTSSLNSNSLSQHDDNLRHSQPTDTLEKKKDSIQICPERDRRRGRESTDSCSDSSRLNKVPDSLDIKRELESDTRQRDTSVDSNDASCKKNLVEFIERRKDSSQPENVKTLETLDRRKEKDSTSTTQEPTKQREKKDQSSKKDKEGEHLESSRHKTTRKSPESTNNQRHKENPKSSLHSDNARHRESLYRRESESSEDNIRMEDKKEPENNHKNKCKDSSYRKEISSHEALHNLVNKLEEISERKDTDIPNNRHKESNRHLDYSRHKDNDRKRESFFDSLHKEMKREEDTESVKLKSNDFIDTELRHSKQLNCDNSSLRLKDHDRRKEGEKLDSKLKTINDAMENVKSKSSEKAGDKESINQISEWVEEIRKDLECSGFAKAREPTSVDSNLDRKPFDTNQLIEVMKNDDLLAQSEIKKENDFESSYKENDRRKNSDYYDKKRSCDTAEIFRRKELGFKKELNEIDGTKVKDVDKKKDNDFLDSFKHRSSNDRRKEVHDRDIHKESFDFEKKPKSWLDDRSDEKKAEEKSKQFVKEFKRSETDYDSDSFENQKDFEGKLNFVDHHEEEVLKKSDLYKKEKKKERLNSWPAAIGGKRRLSSQDSLEICSDESKKSKPERRDSKDSCRSSSSSKKSNCEKYNKSFTKLLEEKIKEDKEKELNKKKKEDESFELSKLVCKREKKISGERRRDEQKLKIRPKENGITASESEAGSGDDGSKTPKKHSIFDIVDEEPAYISMYDKVKARSTKNMQKQEEEKRQERLKEKFNQLKQSRAKREEKKRSTSYDEDSDSERGGRRSNKLMITSSEEDACSEGDLRTKGRKIMSDTSEDDTHRNLNISRTKSLKINSDDFEPKSRKVMSETSEDDTVRFSIGRIKEISNHRDDSVPKMRKILSDTSEDDILKRSSISKNKMSRIQSDESEVELGHEEHKKNDFVKKTNDYTNSDLFSNISEDPEHPHSDFEREQTDPIHRNSIDSISDLPRKKSHKKKQKRQKNSEEGEDVNSKRHSSKKDRRKSSHSHDGDDDQNLQIKARKKKSRDNSSKREGKMEDIFGPLSDDSDKVRGKWNVSQIYGSDSDEERQVVRKREKRRKERKARELDEAGRALEAKLMEPYENLQHLEDHAKSKKKKRKKSREERMNKHHHQRLEEAADRVHEADSEHEPEPSVDNIPPSSLPRLMDSPPPSINQNKKPDIPGFGSQVDENIHETAVKSISESPIKPIEEKQELIEEPPPPNPEDKPTPVISQEETEDAVAALLLEDSFGNEMGSGGFENYTKPDTPVSEPDLQIDTDTEDTFDAIDFSRPPRTPDIPTSFYRQQDTREGLEERILALACPDNTSGKQDEGSSPASSPKSLQISSSQDSDQENKATENTKDTKTITPVDTKMDIGPDSKRKETTEKAVSNFDSVKRHDLPTVCQNEMSHSVQPAKVNYSETSIKKVPDQPLPKIIIGKNSSQPEKPSTIPQVTSKKLLSPTPPPLLHTSSTSPKDGTCDLNHPFSAKQTQFTESSKTIQNVTAQLSSPVVFSAPAQDVHKSSDSHLDKTPLIPKSLNQIIVSPPTSVALIVQTQPKLSQTGQQSTVLHMTTKIHSPGNAQVEIKGNSQMSYMIHHNLQQSQAPGSQIVGNRMLAQQSSGQIHPGTHKLSVSTAPNPSKSPIISSSKSPGAPGSTKSPVQDQQFKQIVISQPHNQQLSVNVSHSHHVNANLLLSPGHQLNVNHSPATHHSQATLSFSPHHMKVPLAQQHINSINSNVLQLSPNIHQQASPVPNNQQKATQHSPASHPLLASQHVASNLQLKSGTHLLQPVANCVSPVPGKLMSPTSGTKSASVHNIPGMPVRHLSPVPQQNTVHKINAHVIQSPPNAQQVRTVVLQNQSKQTVTLLQSQVVQKLPGNQIIRPPATTPLQTVQTLTVNPPLLIEKSKLQPELPPKSDPQTVKTDLLQVPTSESAHKLSEGAFHQTAPSKEDSKVSSVTNENDKGQIESNKITNKPVEENKLLSPVVHDLTCKTSPAKRSPSPMIKNIAEDSNQKITKPSEEGIKESNNTVKPVELKELIKQSDKTELSTERNPNIDPPVQAVQKNEVTKGDSLSEETSNKPTEVNKDSPKLNMAQVATVDNSSDIKQIPEPSKALPLPKKEEKPNKPTEELKVEKIRIKKEENGLCIDQTPVRPVQTTSSNQDSDKEQKTDTKEGSDKSPNEAEETHLEDDVPEHPVAEDTPLATTARAEVGGRGRGGRRRKASGRVGGVVTRRARLNSNVTAPSDLASTDVYEFRDDSEEEARPRLILTIKSPPDPAVAAVAPAPTSAALTNVAPASPPSQTAPASTSNLAQPACRKSRRLQEKDGSRSTVDDTIEDVIRSTRNGRRATRAAVNRAVSPVPEPRKSPRRKQSVAGPVPGPVPAAAATPAVPVTPVAGEATPTPAAEPKNPTAAPPVPPLVHPTPPLVKPTSTEPMTLIDPVTGLLIPMRESEEGQYIPVNTDHIRPPLESKEESGEPVEKRARTTLPTESEASLLSRPGKVPPNCAVVPPLPPKQSVTPLLKPAGIVAPSGIPRPTTALPTNPLPLTKPLTISTPPIAAISKASVTNVVGPMTINRVVAPPVSPSGKPAVPNISSTTPLNHKSHLVQAVAHRGKVPVAKVPAPMTPKQHILHSITNVGREGIVGPGTPPPPHHGALLTGSVASPPLRAPHHISQQPVVTGASSTRVVCKGLVEPLKVEPGSCIVVPTASPQSRSQVLQAGLPVPAYEASLGEVVQHVNFPPHHIQPAHYVHPQLVYQQYLREAALTGYHLPAGVKAAEVDERSAGVVSSPPLELRRGSPHDRTTDSPQVATVYVHGSRHLYFEPPPAHRPSQPRLQVATPPHASQVPPQADSLLMLLQRYPVMWQGLLALKTDQAAVQMHFVFGNPHVARDSLPCNSDGTTPPLRIAQRMRLEQTQVEGVARKMQMDNEHCMLLALPCGRDHMDVLQQSNNLQSGFITYLQQKQAAGIVNIAGPGSLQAAYVVHIFPSCDFANESLARIAPDLLHRVANIAHLLIVIATV